VGSRNIVPEKLYPRKLKRFAVVERINNNVWCFLIVGPVIGVRGEKAKDECWIIQ
jgi:hypothetical protein